jgi:cell division septation protein DedD
VVGSVVAATTEAEAGVATTVEDSMVEATTEAAAGEATTADSGAEAIMVTATIIGADSDSASGLDSHPGLIGLDTTMAITPGMDTNIIPIIYTPLAILMVCTTAVLTDTVRMCTTPTLRGGGAGEAAYSVRDDPPETPAYVADGQWHHFGEEPVAMARAGSQKTGPDSQVSDPALVRSAYLAEGQWRRFTRP